MYRVALMLILGSVTAAAEELPKNLLLKCEGKRTLIVSKPTIDTLTPVKFEVILRLRDGELADTDSYSMTTKNCELRNGVVFCTNTATFDNQTDGGSVTRSIKSYINRETGEYNLFMENTLHTGRNGTGKKSEGMKLARTGICRPISKPIF